jgi:hypothetical protein
MGCWGPCSHSLNKVKRVGTGRPVVAGSEVPGRVCASGGAVVNEIDTKALVAAIAAAFGTVEAPAVEAVVVKPSKVERKVANQTLNRKINAQLANATKASAKGDTAKVVASLEKADALCPAHWGSTKARIVAKAEKLALVLA